MKEIDDKIKAYYANKSLSNNQIDKIVGEQKPVKNKMPNMLMRFAAIFLLLVAAAFFYFNKTTPPKKVCIVQKYAKAVAFNHNKKLESDILTEDVLELNEKMDKLNFEIHLPESLTQKYSLLGGRYCSIDERMAAQLKLKEKENQSVSTLYVLKKLENEKFNNNLMLDSTRVKMWNEKSNLFVLASSVYK